MSQNCGRDLPAAGAEPLVALAQSGVQSSDAAAVSALRGPAEPVPKTSSLVFMSRVSHKYQVRKGTFFSIAQFTHRLYILLKFFLELVPLLSHSLHTPSLHTHTHTHSPSPHTHTYTLTHMCTQGDSWSLSVFSKTSYDRNLTHHETLGSLTSDRRHGHHIPLA